MATTIPAASVTPPRRPAIPTAIEAIATISMTPVTGTASSGSGIPQDWNSSTR
jgi:hypothetical protein